MKMIKSTFVCTFSGLSSPHLSHIIHLSFFVTMYEISLSLLSFFFQFLLNTHCSAYVWLSFSLGYNMENYVSGMRIRVGGYEYVCVCVWMSAAHVNIYPQKLIIITMFECQQCCSQHDWPMSAFDLSINEEVYLDFICIRKRSIKPTFDHLNI